MVAPYFFVFPSFEDSINVIAVVSPRNKTIFEILAKVCECPKNICDVLLHTVKNVTIGHTNIVSLKRTTEPDGTRFCVTHVVLFLLPSPLRE